MKKITKTISIIFTLIVIAGMILGLLGPIIF